MSEIPRLPESELEIMMVIWEAEGAVNSEYIQGRLKKDWARTTLLNFLIRLCERGFLSCKKIGRTNFYTPRIGKDAYLKKEHQSILKKLHQKSITSLIASLYQVHAISDADLDELEKFIKEAK